MLRIGFAVLSWIGVLLLAVQGVQAHEGFPRLMGMNIGEKHYGDPEYQRNLSRLDIIVLGFYRGWGREPEAMRQVVLELKRKNRNLLVGQYGILSELRDEPWDGAKADSREAVTSNDWWLRNQAGERLQWTSRFNAWEVNFTALSAPDSDGRRYPEWLAERDHRVFYEPVPEFDFWYTDNVQYRPRVRADWDGDGVDNEPESPSILSAWREGYVALWQRIRELSPGKWIMVNPDRHLAESEFRDQVEAVFLEGLMGRSWSIEAHYGWEAMMARYRAVKGNLRDPRIVGFNVWGDPGDYGFFRYAYTSCLLDDGYFSFTDANRGYSSVPWFDEYEIELGRAVSPPPKEPWQDGVWRRDYEHGIALVNPAVREIEIELEPGFRRFVGHQSPDWNNGSPVLKLVLPSKDGVVLIRDRKTVQPDAPAPVQVR